MIYLHRIVDRDTLVSLTVKENEKSIWFYLPGMSDGAKPWASTKKGETDYSCRVSKEDMQAEVTFQIHGTVKNVLAGNLLTLEFDGIKFPMRLWETSVPSYGHKHFEESKKHLERLCEHQKVIAYCRKRNAADEFLCVLKLDGENLNERIVADGYASAGPDGKYKHLEAEARQAVKGLWASTAKSEEWF